MSGTPKKLFGLNSAHTIANGTAGIVIADITVPSPTQAVRHVDILINGNRTGGANGSFKANAVPGSYIRAQVQVLMSEQPAVWRGLTPDTGEYRLRTIDEHDIIHIDGSVGMSRFRVVTYLEIAPLATIDLNWDILFDTDQED